MGGKPNPGTPRDGRLKTNGGGKPKPTTPAKANPFKPAPKPGTKGGKTK